MAIAIGKREGELPHIASNTQNWKRKKLLGAIAASNMSSILVLNATSIPIPARNFNFF